MFDYKYIIFDAQYLLVRNWKALNSRYIKKEQLFDDTGLPIMDEGGRIQTYEVVTMTPMDIVKSFFYTIAKFTREVASCRKIILVFDSAPYHKLKFIEDYKGSRYYATQEDLEEIDKVESPLEYAQLKEELRQNELKNEAKRFIIENFGKLGMPVLIYKGYEADDLAYLMALNLRNDKEKSCLASIDGDWSYLINKNVDWVKTNTNEKFTYDDKFYEVGCLEEFDISLFQYKALIDSIYGSHNDLVSTIKSEFKGTPRDIIEKILKGDYQDLEDEELFKTQLKSFDFKGYPEFTQVIDKIISIGEMGTLMDIEDYENFKSENNFQVRTEYYSNYCETLDKKLYKMK